MNRSDETIRDTVYRLYPALFKLHYTVLNQAQLLDVAAELENAAAVVTKVAAHLGHGGLVNSTSTHTHR